ncbi:16S rRNA (cytidine(1402)-2'-O)-methyltransferase [Leptospira gomenensis]|uniref:Ribosomal RNA small subunit methyltransferase I n=1 Tax=Leptospira gomenensis TaxID=2484974 RepID=A0A5F1Y889_9LEPT|nr:16S rRNA (cytidine(1402)-2'-O)-methyltransferase [Leptospira gomenensis]TGK31484.1 16S rRNA (cytidine(1402)-2'-O)-methyltransferase [Leptospira gomenensis]TGK32474.1 16S rRNA (cytidine(1402)-2'-O)-methyltransferase [Leptospira gomenensis]TGK46189.1 16S rRNA (cytidine(1402)-2'-O)-methyltransferase [Leptospira gomenensis]TGK54714.1 16S rRNA (cytidine(1402)-2'-O)-methyltransferase [Leptospira gomenensis]
MSSGEETSEEPSETESSESESLPLQPGTLYVVSTPIGNLEDLTFRALRILKNTDRIFCENAGHSRKLFRHYSITTPASTLYRDQSETPYVSLLEELRSGKNFALVSDAGTPGVSDPGSQLIRTVREAGFVVASVPGPSAVTALLGISGWQANPFLFLGFLSEKKGKKRNQLGEWKSFEGLLMFFESVHRIDDSLCAVREIFPDCEFLIGREMTKIHEQILLISPLHRTNAEEFARKGEFVVLINTNRKKMLKGALGTADRIQ